MSIFDGLSDIFTEALGEPVTYTPVDGEPVTINAFIEDSALVAQLGTAGETSNQVVAHVRTEDVPSAREGDSLIWLARLFKLVEPITQDGRGMTTLTLEKVSA